MLTNTALVKQLGICILRSKLFLTQQKIMLRYTAEMPWCMKFAKWSLIFVGPQYGTGS
jgi:hypothetical protein